MAEHNSTRALKQCKNVELTVGKAIPNSEKREATEKIIDYYARIIFRYQATACIVSIVVGLLMDKIYHKKNSR